MKFLFFISLILIHLTTFAQSTVDFQALDKLFQKKKFTEFEKQTKAQIDNNKALPQKTLLQWAYVSEENMNFPMAAYLLMFVQKHTQNRELKEKVKDIIDNKNLNINSETINLQDLSFQDYAIKYLRFINLTIVGLSFLLLVQMFNNTRKGKSFSYRPIILVFFLSLLLAFNNILKPTIFALVATENCLVYQEKTSASPVSLKLEKGKIIKVIEREKEWTKVELNHQQLWVKSSTLFNLFQLS